MALRKDIVFLALDTPRPPASILEYLRTVDYTFGDRYRNCSHIPLRTPDAHIDPVQIKTYKDDDPSEWTDIAKGCPDLIEYYENYIEPLAGLSHGKMFCIVTEPNTDGYEHIDCGPGNWDKINLKYRCVLHGSVSSMYMITEDGEKLYPEVGDQPFLMAGNYPHGVRYRDEGKKYTIAFGAPWRGDDEDNDYLDDIIGRSINKYGYISRKEVPPTADYQKYFPKS